MDITDSPSLSMDSRLVPALATLVRLNGRIWIEDDPTRPGRKAIRMQVWRGQKEWNSLYPVPPEDEPEFCGQSLAIMLIKMDDALGS